MTDTTETSTNKWSRARNRLMIPSNLDDCRDTFLLANAAGPVPTDCETFPSNAAPAATLPPPQPSTSPLFQYPPTSTAESRAERLKTTLRTPCTNLLPQALKVLQRAAEKYGQGNVLLASDPPPEIISPTEDVSPPLPSPASVLSFAKNCSVSSSSKKAVSTKIGATGSTIPTTTSLNRKTALKYLRSYLSINRLDSHCTVKFCDNLPSAGIFVNRPRATLARINCDDAYFGGDEDCKHSLLVSDKLLSSAEKTVSALRIVSFAVHEIGTHLVRRSNEEIQPWLRKHTSYKMVKEERLIKATEEGLAMVHEAMHLPSLLLARPALYYFASARALHISFVDLFVELKEWVSDALQRFEICALVKRGMEDTHQPGGNGEVQVYFEGAVKILEQVDTIDPALLFCGRITLDDMELSRVKRVVRREGILLPGFARNIYQYRKALRRISLANGIVEINTRKKKMEAKPESEVLVAPGPVAASATAVAAAPSLTSCKRRKKTRSKQVNTCPTIVLDSTTLSNSCGTAATGATSKVAQLKLKLPIINM